MERYCNNLIIFFTKHFTSIFKKKNEMQVGLCFDMFSVKSVVG